MRQWADVLVGVLVRSLLPFAALLIAMSVFDDTNIVVLQNQGESAINVTLKITSTLSRWQVHLPRHACTLLQFHVGRETAMQASIAGGASEEFSYYTRRLGGVECVTLPLNNCDIPALAMQLTCASVVSNVRG